MSAMQIIEIVTITVELVMATMTVFYVARSHYSGRWRFEKTTILLSAMSVIFLEAVWVGGGFGGTSQLFHIGTNASNILWMLGVVVINRRESHDLIRIANRMVALATMLESMIERGKNA